MRIHIHARLQDVMAKNTYESVIPLVDANEGLPAVRGVWTL